MRCKNCGWPNRPNESTCSKCGTLLQSDEVEYQYIEDHSNKTVMEGAIFDGGSAQSNTCLKCGYPLRPENTQCPNCGANVGLSIAPRPQGTSIESTVRRPTIVGTPNFQGTINVWTNGAIGLVPSITLSPIKRNGERKELSDIVLEGENISLNRDVVDPGNLSITSQQQAIIYRKDDKWCIEDKSDQKTTFVHVSQPLELHDGDVILLGNRLFVFHE